MFRIAANAMTFAFLYALLMGTHPSSARAFSRPATVASAQLRDFITPEVAIGSRRLASVEHGAFERRGAPTLRHRRYARPLRIEVARWCEVENADGSATSRQYRACLPPSSGLSL